MNSGALIGTDLRYWNDDETQGIDVAYSRAGEIGLVNFSGRVYLKPLRMQPHMELSMYRYFSGGRMSLDFGPAQSINGSRAQWSWAVRCTHKK